MSEPFLSPLNGDKFPSGYKSPYAVRRIVKNLPDLLRRFEFHSLFLFQKPYQNPVEAHS